MMGFEEVDHTADKALRVFGASLTELFLSAAAGLTHLMASDVSDISTEIEKSIELEAIDAESLLVEWLSELAYWAESEMLLFKKFRIQKATSIYLKAKVFGGKTSMLEKQIKAVTYHDLKIIKTAEGLEATIVFDV
jgi:SHS2 domain-containing protein